MIQPPSAALTGPGILAVLRAEHIDDCRPAIATLADAGVTAIELTMTTPGVLEHLETIVDEVPPGVTIGLGTVVDAATVAAAGAAGGRFIVTPAVAPDVIAAAAEHHLEVYPGGLTPTELIDSWGRGVSAVKLFPAATVGPDYIRHLHGPYPDLAVIPSGGVDISAVGDWSRAGALAVSLGGPLLGDSLKGGSQTALRDRTLRVVDAVAAARNR